MTALYDEIGVGYKSLRQPDPRIAELISTALGDAECVLNVGAGAGSYEPQNRLITAVEPSAEMIRQRPESTTKVIQGCAEDLPFGQDQFDASMAVLTVHHWTDMAQGLRELRRVTRQKIVIFTFDHTSCDFWLEDYIPNLFDQERQTFPALEDFEEVLGRMDVTNVPIPHDCSDGFMCAYWRRPDAYLNENCRRAISTFSRLGDVSTGLSRLRADIGTGAWHARYTDLLGKEECDLGYRLLITEGVERSRND